MARLPGIRYNNPVQSLGREDVYGPIKVANAQAQAALQIQDAINKVTTVIETNEVAKQSAKFSNEMSELNAEVKNRKVYSNVELDALDIDYQDTYQQYNPEIEGGYEEIIRSEIPSHEVSVDYYKKRAEQIYSVYSDGLSRRGKKVMDKVFASKYGTGITSVTEQSIKYANQYAQAEAELNFEAAVNASSAEGAIMIAETALANNTWTPIYYASKMGPMLGRVTERGYLNQLDQIDDPDQLEDMQEEILNNENMTNGQMSGLNKMYETKIQRQNKRIERALKEQSDEASSMALTQLSAELTLTDLDFQDPAMLVAAISGMNRSDRKSAIAIWRAERNKVKESDTKSLLHANLLVRGTILPNLVDNSSFIQRRSTARAMITDMVSNGEITVTDYTSLLDDLNKIRNIPFKSPEYKMVEENIFTMFSGGSKSILTAVLPTGKFSIGYANTMWELNNAALESGPGFDARKWWERRKPEILDRTIKSNIESWEQSSAAAFAIKTANDKLDMSLTIRNIDNQVTKGMLSRSQANEYIAEAKETQDDGERLDAERIRMRDKITRALQ